MSVRLYIDVNVPRAITDGLRRKGIDVLTAQEDGTREWDDSALLDRSTRLGRVLFTQDQDLLREAAERQSTGQEFAGVVYARQGRIGIGKAIADLHMLAEVHEPIDIANRVEHLPL